MTSPPSGPNPSLSHRRGSRRIRVLGPDGRPLPGVAVTVGQTRHAFSFGNIGFDFVPDGDEPFSEGGHDAALAPLWLELFNTATLPFYWAQFEPERGRPRTRALRSTAEWFRGHGVAIKGHPLVWHTLTAPWLLDLPVDDIEREQRNRIRRDVTAFRGLVDSWDAINEAVIMPVFTNGANGITRLCRERGRLATISMAFDEARAADPDAVLVINDFDLSAVYERLIEEVLDAGIRIDSIGLQTHMHQGYWGEDRMLETIDRFARFGIPLQLTETTLLSGGLMPPDIEDLNDYRVASWPSTPEGEERQAEEIVRHYRSVVSHPAVNALTYWGLTDADAWLGAPVGLLRADGSRKPSYDALHSLVKGEWWMPPTTLRTEDDGMVDVSGFLGSYLVESGCVSRTFDLVDGAGSTDPLVIRMPR